MRHLKDPRLWIAIGLLCLGLLTWLLGALITTGNPPQPTSPLIRALLIVLIYAGVGIAWLIARLQTQHTNSQVLSGIADSATATTTANDSINTDEEKQVREKFARAVALLKKTRFTSPRGSRTLYELPWYVIIGSPGSGKTTAIRHSGLDFPLADVTGDNSLGGIGGTRNCDWWFTSEAVLLDTAGRYTTQDSNKTGDAQGWQNFLGLLRKHRKRRPINGALVAIGMDEMLNLSVEQRLQHARTIRARLDELKDQLQVHFPVYLLITKSDLLVGFREFFDDLSREEQDQVWGCTLPAVASSSSLPNELVALSQRLQQQLPWRLNSERDLRRRQTMINFPWQFEQLKPRLAEFVSAVFAQHPMQPQHLLRGIYFTSAIQQGSPIERLLAGVTAGFGFQGSLGTAGVRDSRSLFLKRMFRDVVFTEAELAGTNIKQERQIRLVRTAAFIGIAGLASLIALVWIGAFGSNKILLNETQKHLSDYQSINTSPRNPQQIQESIAQLEQAATVYEQQSHPWLSRLGMYDGSVDTAAKGAFVRALEHSYLPVLGQQLARWMINGKHDYTELLGALKAYLMLADSGHRNKEYLQQWVMQTPTLTGDENQRQQQASYLTALIEQRPDFTLAPLDNKAIAQTRQALLNMPPADRIYGQIRQAFQNQSFNLKPLLGPGFGSVFHTRDDQSLLISQLFTTQGYQQVDFSPSSDYMKQLQEDQWVFGEDQPNLSDEELRVISAAIEQKYFQDYVKAWRSVYNNLAINNFGTPEALLAALQKLSEPTTSPLSVLLRITAEQTQLPEKKTTTQSLAGKLVQNQPAAQKILTALSKSEADSSGRAIVRESFADINRLTSGGGTNKDSQIVMTLSELRQWLSAIYMSGDAGGTALQAAGSGAVGLDPAKKTLMLAEELPIPVSSWIVSLAQSASGGVTSSANAFLNQAWSEQVGVACKAGLAGRYPLQTGARGEVALNDFIEYFKPGGVEDAFVKQYLDKYIDKASWTLKRGAPTPLSSNTLSVLRTGQQIREAFFPAGAGAINLPFRLKPVKMDAQLKLFSLQLGSRRVEYSHGPKLSTDANWPEDGNHISLLFQDLNDQSIRRDYEGTWALFHALDSARLVTPDVNGGLNVSFYDGSHEVTFQMSSSQRFSPFYRDWLSRYRCLDRL